MSPEQIIDIFKDSIYLIIIIVSSLVLPGLIVGLCVSIIQAATQINEQTLSFVPRLLVTFVSSLVLGPWLLGLVLDYTQQLILGMGDYIG